MPDNFYTRHQNRIQSLLAKLEDKPLRHKDLLNEWLLSGGSFDQLNRTLRFLKAKGYVRKADPEQRLSPYEITVAGQKHLAGLRA